MKYCNLDELGIYYAKWKKKNPDTKKGQMYDSTYMKYLKKTKSQREKEE